MIKLHLSLEVTRPSLTSPSTFASILLITIHQLLLPMIPLT
uniref:Uncharacterized protein n=1 Tax=Brassica campestris TaxID=3711 RepID=A0A3P6A6T3_BRACM|nr:unnamed protein product [Brassica rapa]